MNRTRASSVTHTLAPITSIRPVSSITEWLDDPAAPAHDALLDAFAALDDTDVLYSLKRWTEARDPVLADLARRFVDRDLFRTTTLDAAPDDGQRADWRDRTAAWLVAEGLSTPADAEADARLYVADGVARLAAYRADEDAISILERDGTVRELSEAAGAPTAGALEARRERAYVCLPKAVAP